MGQDRPPVDRFLPETHKCAHPECQAQIAKTKFLCPRHWREVPQRLRDQLQAAYNRWSRGYDEQAAHLRAAQAEVLATWTPASPPPSSGSGPPTSSGSA